MSAPSRGRSDATMRIATCKDCQREIDHLDGELSDARASGDQNAVRRIEGRLERRQQATFTYSEFAANGVLDRGGSRSDRCPEHRRKHQANIQGMAVAYVDLATVGVAVGADDPDGPTGPFGGLGPLPNGHESETRSADLSKFEFGMTDADIVRILEILRHKRVLVLRAGTGTGKSTFGPFRLMDPPSLSDLQRLGLLDELERDGIDLPPEGPFRLTDIGPIVVTEPRVAAATGVSQFVGEKLAMGCTLKQCSNPAHGTFNPKAHPDGPDGVRGPSCENIEDDDPAKRCFREHVGKHPGVGPSGKLPSGCEVSDCSSHIGPGFPVGYHAAGVRNWDDSCQIVYATDGAVINWLRDGRLSRIGTVIVDEAHERSTNIDFILGFLKRDLAKYPHLRVIITSATFNPEFYREYFGKEVAEVMDIPAVKSVGYGMPLFPELDASTDEMARALADGATWDEPWPLIAPVDEDEDEASRFIREHWPPTYDEDGIVHTDERGMPTALAPPLKESEVTDPRDIGFCENLHDTTRKLLDLRLPTAKVPLRERWQEEMPDVLADFIVGLVHGLDQTEPPIFGDILGFLPTGRSINATCEKITAALGKDADVCPLLSSLSTDEIDRALSARKKGDKRKIVISTNLAETSLTVEGVRFVVDTGLIAQSSWDSRRATGRVGTTDHSRSGIKQRWGRVGRKAPGWVFPLYSKAQFAGLDADTSPGSARENLEALMMTARMGGVDDVRDFPWPAAFVPSEAELDGAAKDAMAAFVSERDRADSVLRANGAVNHKGHPTTFGKELVRFSGMGSTASAMAVMYADRLACVPEVLTILGLLEDCRLIGPSGLLHDEYAWPDEWRVEAAGRHRGLASLAEDDAHLALLITSAWERADASSDPWEPSPARRAWARQWWINDQVLLEMAVKRKEVLRALSPGMKKPVRRPVELALLDRARLLLGRTMPMFEFQLDGDEYLPVLISAGTDDAPHEQLRYAVENDSVIKTRPQRVLALRRREDRGGDSRVSNLVALPPRLPSDRDSRPESSVADAMELLLHFREHAPPDPDRQIALSLIEEWPVGQRRLVHGTETLADTAPIAPFARPRSDEEAEQDGVSGRRRRTKRKRARRFDDDGEPLDAEATDTSTELPGKVRGVDEDRALTRSLERAGRAIDERACGTCDDCLAGRVADCRESPEQLPRAHDALEKWNQSAERSGSEAARSVALSFPGGGPSAEPTWFEVSRYDLAAAPTVILAEDWRAADADPDPARHPDDDPGDVVTVRIGAIVEDHSGELRVFDCVDRRDRFLLREADRRPAVQMERGQIAISLDLGHQGLLKDLRPGGAISATVVPARAPDTVTITLLQHLRQHLETSHTVQLHRDLGDTKSVRDAFHPSVVESAVNEYGRWSVRVLSQDSALGLRHVFELRTTLVRQVEDEDELLPPPEATFVEGQPIAVKLGQSMSSLRKLNVGGLDLDKLERIVADSLRTLELKGLSPSSSEAQDLKEDDPADNDDITGELAEIARPAPPDARIALRGDSPLSRGIALALAELDPADVWQRRVWTYWARSHHVSVTGKNAIRESQSSDMVDHHIETTIINEVPLEVRQAELSEFAARTVVGSTLEAMIAKAHAKHYDVSLGDGLEAILPMGEVTWDVDADPARLLGIGETHLVLLKEPVDLSGTKRPVVSLKRLQPDPLDAYLSRHPVKSRVTGTVREVHDKKAHIDLARGVIGLLTIGDLSHSHVDSMDEVVRQGQSIEVVVSEALVSQRMIRVSRRAALAHPFDAFVAANREGALVACRVTEVLGGSASVELVGGVKGFVTIGDVAWERPATVAEILAVGDRFDAIVIGFERRTVRLSRKALLPKPFEQFRLTVTPGDVISGTVSSVKDLLGAFVTLAPGVDGLIHISKLAAHHVARTSDVVSEGQVVSVRILAIDVPTQKISLALVGTTTPPAVRTVTAPPPAPTPAFARRPTPVTRPLPRAKRSARGEGASVEAAARNAAAALGLSRTQVKVTVLRDLKVGLFGRTRGTAEVEVTEI